jgi:hypothetical protein
MHHRAILLLVLGLSTAAPAAAQDATGTAALARYLGTWIYEGEGNGGRVSCRSERRWIANNAFVESHRECSTPNGPITQVEIYGYNSRRGLFVYWGFNGNVPSTYVASVIAGTVAWTGEDASARARCKETFAADLQSSTSECEFASDGTTWQRVAFGTSKKVQ